MPTARYEDSDGFRVRSVTTITSHWGDKGGMIHAANKLGLEGKCHRDVWRPMAKLGTLVHEVITGALLAEPERRAEATDELVEAADVPSGILDEFASCIAGWHQLLRDAKLGPCILAEEHLVSDEHGYGGTPDAALIQGAPAVADVKTGSVYQDVVMQLAAYRQLLREHGHDCRAGYVIQLNRDGGGYVLRYYNPEVLDTGWGWFLAVKSALEAEDVAKAMCR